MRSEKARFNLIPNPIAVPKSLFLFTVRASPKPVEGRSREQFLDFRPSAFRSKSTVSLNEEFCMNLSSSE